MATGNDGNLEAVSEGLGKGGRATQDHPVTGVLS